MDQEKLKLKLDSFKQALITLEEALNTKSSIDSKLIRDAGIQRFEYCYELCWKTSKSFLEEKFAVDLFSPKPVFREFLKNQLITAEETELLLDMCKDRNTTTHIYEEKIIKIIHGHIRNYYQIMKKLAEIISKHISD